MSQHLSSASLQSLLHVSFHSIQSHPSISQQFSKIRILFPKKNNEYVPNQGTTLLYNAVGISHEKASVIQWKLANRSSSCVPLKIRDVDSMQHKYKILIQFYAKNRTESQQHASQPPSDQMLTHSDILLRTYHVSLHELFLSRVIQFQFSDKCSLTIFHSIKEMANVQLSLKNLQYCVPANFIQHPPAHLPSTNYQWKTFLRYSIKNSTGNLLHHQHSADDKLSTHHYETQIVDAAPINYWDDLESITFHTSTEDLLNKSLFVEAFRIQEEASHSKYILDAMTEVSLRNPMIFEKYFPIQQEILPANPQSAISGPPRTLSCLLSIQNLPRFVQYMESSLVISCMNDARTMDPPGRQLLLSPFIRPIPPRASDGTEKTISTNTEDQSSMSSSEEQTLEQKRKKKRREIGKFSTEQAPALNSQTATGIIISGEKNLTVQYAYHQDGIMNGVVQSEKPLRFCRGSYFEMRVLQTGFTNCISLGLAPKLSENSTLNGFNLGFAAESYAMNSEGNKLISGKSSVFSTEFDAGDTVGCGIDEEAIYFTRNGKFIGVAFFPVATSDDVLFPTVQISSSHTKVRLNFGQERFKFNVVKHASPPPHWYIRQDVSGRVYYKNVRDQTQSFHDPRDAKPEWTKYQEMHECLVRNLCTPRKGKWRGISSRWLMHALRAIPRASFVESDSVHVAGSGMTIECKRNESSSEIMLAHDTRTASPQYHLSAQIIARALDALQLERGDKFMHFGCGSGWATAMAALLVGREGQSIGVDRDPSLLKGAQNSLRSLVRYTGLSLDAAQFCSRIIFGLENKWRKIPVNIGRDFTAMFVERLLTPSQIDYLGSMFCAKKSRNSRLVCFVHNEEKSSSQSSRKARTHSRSSRDQPMYTLMLFEHDGQKWSRGTPLMECAAKYISSVEECSAAELQSEKRFRLCEYLENNGFPAGLVHEAIRLIGEDDWTYQRVIDFAFLCFSFPGLGEHFSNSEILQHLRQLGVNGAHMYFSQFWNVNQYGKARGVVASHPAGENGTGDEEND